MGELPPKLFFRIGEVAGLVGVEPHVLRYWEREFRSIRPTKSAKGQRVYSRKDVENLLRVRDLLYRDGFTIAGAKKKLGTTSLHTDELSPHAHATAVTTHPLGSSPSSATAATAIAYDEPSSSAPISISSAQPPSSQPRVREKLVALRTEIEAFLAESPRRVGGENRILFCSGLVMAAVPTLVDQAPPGWVVAADVAQPKISESSGAVMTAWKAHRAPDDSAVMVSGCVATPIPGWVDDMAPAVEARTFALAGASAERITGYPIDASRNGAFSSIEGDKLVLRPASDLSGPQIGIARTFIGFDESRVLTCFATCVAASRADPFAAACESSVINARLEGGASPPAPNVALRSATWAIHHPRPTAFGAAILVTLAGILAVVLRRRPRSA